MPPSPSSRATQAALDRTAAEIADETGQAVLPVAADLADRAALAGAFATIEARLGGVDILVNNSGGPPPSGVGGIDPELWRRQFEMMVLNIIGLTDLALPGMRARGWGRILTVASSSVIQPIASIGISNTLRSALVGWSKTISGEIARDGVTANMLLPGRIATQRIIQLDNVTVRRPTARPPPKSPSARPPPKFRSGAMARSRNSAPSRPSWPASMPAMSPAA